MQKPLDEYLVSYGVNGYFGLFRPESPRHFIRGERVLIRGHRGTEVGVVLCHATAGHRQTLSERLVGTILRRAEEAAALDAPIDPVQAYAEAMRLADTLAAPFAVIDVEVILEPRGLVVHHLGGPHQLGDEGETGGGDPRPFVSALAKHFDARIELMEAGLGEPEAEPAEGGCGLPGCGGGNCETSGGCNSCGACHSEPVNQPAAELVALRPSVRANEFMSG